MRLLLPGTQVLSILEAVLMVSPKSENLGTLVPTKPLRGVEMCGNIWTCVEGYNIMGRTELG